MTDPTAFLLTHFDPTAARELLRVGGVFFAVRCEPRGEAFPRVHLYAHERCPTEPVASYQFVPAAAGLVRYAFVGEYGALTPALLAVGRVFQPRLPPLPDDGLGDLEDEDLAVYLSWRLTCINDRSTEAWLLSNAERAALARLQLTLFP